MLSAIILDEKFIAGIPGVKPTLIDIPTASKTPVGTGLFSEDGGGEKRFAIQTLILPRLAQVSSGFHPSAFTI